MEARPKQYYVYIMSSFSKRLYVGVTNDLYRRVYEHKHHLVEGFAKKYNLTHLVYFEVGEDVSGAISHEKLLKGWLRSKKIGLIESFNPQWDDLAQYWFKDQDEPVMDKQANS